MAAAPVRQPADPARRPHPRIRSVTGLAVDGTAYPSLDLFAAGFFLTRAEMDWFDSHYCPDVAFTDPRLCPLRAGDLSGLAPALMVTAGFDPLRDEGEAYAAALADAGTAVALRREPGMIHGFINMVDISTSARAAFVGVARELRAMLDAQAEADRTG